MKVWIWFAVAVACLAYQNNTEFWSKLMDTNLSFQAITGYGEIDWYFPKDTSGLYYSLWTAAAHPFPDPSEVIPLIVWLQGGPGASSQFGAFTEVGPIWFDKGNPKFSPHPWNILGHLLCIDQPLNVGFSFQGNRTGPTQVDSANMAADHLLNFLHNFYRQFPSLAASPLYITGESFAGHYIPAFAARILENRTFMESWNLSFGGVAIGDGWTDPINQMNFYDSTLFNAGIVGSKFRDVAKWFQTRAVGEIMEGAYSNVVDGTQATSFFDFLTNNDTTPEAYWGGMSTFNFRKYGPLDQSFVTFLRQHKKIFGVNASVDFIPGNDAVYESFHTDISRSYASTVVYLLGRTRVLIYNGQDDFVVNTAGVLNYLNNLNWIGLPRWKATKKQMWRDYGNPIGWVKIQGNLWFALVNKAGHMVPTDQPSSAFNLLGHFLHNDRNWDL